MSRGRVLLLEDDPALRGLLEEALAIEEFDVVPLLSFDELRDAASRHTADIIVADFWGGGQRTLGDGDRQDIRDLGGLLPVILLTGRSWATSTTAEELGAAALIRKPFDLDHLVAAMQAILANI